ncbi:MAG: YfcE family phosphodiesterase [Caldilineales bacterium]|nr:YfcE family phosphodiesterase [Caldilineales bacterium]
MTQLAILSDTHDNIWALEHALAQIRARGCDLLLHCGDLCSPFVVKQLAEGFAGPIHLIFGNNEGDGRLIQVVAGQFAHVTHHGIYAELEVGGRRIAAIHYPQPALRIAQSGQFDLVCYGHDHAQHCQAIAATLLVNPGEVMGKDHPATWGLYDCAAHRCEILPILPGARHETTPS